VEELALLAAKATEPKMGAAGEGIPSFIGGNFSFSSSAFLACSKVEMA
jgi:hypothetical protein